MKNRKLYSYITRTRLEKRNSKELIKLKKEIEKDLKEKIQYAKEYKTNVSKYCSCYKKLVTEVKKINYFFSKSASIIESKDGFIFKDTFFDIKFKTKSLEDEYIKKYKKLLDLFNTFLELSSTINNSPIWIENYDKRKPGVDLKLNYKEDFNLNVFKYPHAYGGSITTSFPIIKKDQVEMNRTYLDDIWIKELKHNARRFYNRLDQVIIGKFEGDLYQDHNKYVFSHLSSDGAFSVQEKCFDQNLLENELKRNKDETEAKLRQIELYIRRKEKSKEKDENIGYVYVLSNEAYPNIYKIGSTYGLPEERAEELTGTGHLTPFKVKAKFKTQSAEFYEKITHKILNKYRVKQGREFFKLELEKIKNCLTQMLEITDNGKNKKTFDQLNRKIKI